MRVLIEAKIKVLAFKFYTGAQIEILETRYKLF